MPLTTKEQRAAELERRITALEDGYYEFLDGLDDLNAALGEKGEEVATRLVELELRLEAALLRLFAEPDDREQTPRVREE